MIDRLPYTIAVLCYLFGPDGKVLLLHRRKPPNAGLYSPIGGKLDQDSGESPSDCAVRGIYEETGLETSCSELHLTGMVSESGYHDQMHWLMFLYEVTRPVQVQRTVFDEGRLGWHDTEHLCNLAIPETDQQVIWPLFWRYRGRFFAAHIDCTGDHLRWHLQQPQCDVDTNRQTH